MATRNYIMPKNNNETNLIIKPVYQRNVSIDENIFATLSLSALSLYMVFRYEADYRHQESDVKRSAKFLYTKAKISRTQFYTTLNMLEHHGLVLRDPNNQLGEKCVFHVAKELGYFTNKEGVHVVDRGVHVVDRGVHVVDTDHYSFPLLNTTTSPFLSEDFKNTTTTVFFENGKAVNDSDRLVPVDEILEVYREHMPEMVQVRNADKEIINLIKKMQKDWPKYQKERKKFTIPLFIDFLNFVRTNHPWFITPYVTQGGHTKKNSIRELIREKNLSKFSNGEFSVT
jgi:hypothetical protein